MVILDQIPDPEPMAVVLLCSTVLCGCDPRVVPPHLHYCPLEPRLRMSEDVVPGEHLIRDFRLCVVRLPLRLSAGVRC